MDALVKTTAFHSKICGFLQIFLETIPFFAGRFSSATRRAPEEPMMQLSRRRRSALPGAMAAASAVLAYLSAPHGARYGEVTLWLCQNSH